jgi:hypothetical protein
MGIVGLTTFINGLNDKEKRMFDVIRLHNTPLVIDGTNLLHQVYFTNKIKCEYNGNYDELKQKLEAFFVLLKQCHIEPYVLLDGARDVNNEKFLTILERTKDRIQKFTISTSDLTLLDDIKSSNKNQEQFFVSKYLLPLNANLILHEVLVDLKVKFFQCKFEADYSVAQLANILNAPVLSLDSDFYVFDLTHGYISFDNLDLNRMIDDHDDTYLDAKLYKLDNFLDYFGLNTQLKKRLLYVFVLLCGNDYINQNEFANLKQTFINENNNSKSLFHSRYQRWNYFKKVLAWLSQFHTLDDCLATVIKFLGKNCHEHFYRCVNESTVLYGLQDGLKNQREFNNILEYFGISNRSTTGQKSDFLMSYSNGRLSSSALNALFNRNVFVLSQLEIKMCTNTGWSSMGIRKWYYTCLFSYFAANKSPILNDFFDHSVDICNWQFANALAITDNDNTLANQAMPIIVNEYCRHRNEIKIIEILITGDDLTQFSFDYLGKSQNRNSVLCKLLDLPESQIVKLYSNQNTLFSNCKSPSTVDKLRTYFLGLYFCFVQNHPDNAILKPMKNLNFIRVFLIALVKYEFVERLQTTEVDNTNTNDWEIFNGTFDLNLVDSSSSTGLNTQSLKFLNEISKKLNAFKTKSYKYNFKFIHCLGEYQAVYSALFNFNRLFSFLFRFDLLSFHTLDRFFNGTFLHNFFQELQTRIDPDLYIEELLGRKSLLKCLYFHLYDEFVRIFDIDLKAVKKNSSKKADKKQNRMSSKANVKLVETNNRFFLLDEEN